MLSSDEVLFFCAQERVCLQIKNCSERNVALPNCARIFCKLKGMKEQERIVVEIGQILMRHAKQSGADWDYCGYMFETRDGVNCTGQVFMFSEKELQEFNLSQDRKPMMEAFKRFREVTRVEGADYWIKCLAVLRSDGDLKMLFEFENWDRWKISPANIERTYEILIGDAYPEAVQ